MKLSKVSLAGMLQLANRLKNDDQIMYYVDKKTL